MAQFNEILIGRFNQLLTRLFGMKGGAPSPQLAAEVQPVFSIGELQGDLHYLADEYLASVFTSATGDATHPARCALSLTAPGVIAVVERIIISNPDAAAHEYVCSVGGAAIAIATRGQYRDTRARGGAASSVGVGTTTTVAGDGTQLFRVTIPTGNSAIVPFEFVMKPGGSQLQIYMSDNTKNLRVSFEWVERAVTQSELS